MPISHPPVTLEEIEEARTRIEGAAIRTPLVRLEIDLPETEIYLKLEVLQPVGSFKIRGAGSLIGSVGSDDLADGVWTASAGNMAQAVAWFARREGSLHRGDARHRAGREDVGGRTARRLDRQGDVRRVARGVPLARLPGHAGSVRASVQRPARDGRNATIGVEILEDLPEADAVVVPYGGGGLSCGIASAIRAGAPEQGVRGRDRDRGPAVGVTRRRRAGGGPVYAELRRRHRQPRRLPRDVRARANAARRFARRRARPGGRRRPAPRDPSARRRGGAGAVPVAAATAGLAGSGRIVAVVSGGSIDASKLSAILAGSA